MAQEFVNSEAVVLHCRRGGPVPPYGPRYDDMLGEPTKPLVS